MSVITVNGDSMEPFLMSGDTVLVDSTQRLPRQDGIYVIRHDDVVQVKRLTTDPTTGLITISGDNPAYASFTDKSPTDINIFGRVIWLGRRV